MSHKLGMANPVETTGSTQQGGRKRILAKEEEEGKDQPSSQRRGQRVANMISVFDNVSSKNSQEVLTDDPRSRTPVPSSSPLHARLRSSSSSPKLTTKLKPHAQETSTVVKSSPLSTSLVSSHPRNKVAITSTKTLPFAGLIADNKNSRVQRALEIFDNGGLGQQKTATTLKKTSGISSSSLARVREASQRSYTLPSRSSTSVADSGKSNEKMTGTSTRATPAKITIRSSKTQLASHTRSCTSSSASSDEEGVGISPRVVVANCPGELLHNDKKKLGLDETTASSRSSSRSSSVQSCHELTEEVPSDKQSTNTSHATYTLSHSPPPSPSPSMGLNSSEPLSPSPRPYVVQQPGGLWFTTREVLPTSSKSDKQSLDKPWEARRSSSGSTPGRSRKKLSSPLPSQPDDTPSPSGSKSSLNKSCSTHALSFPSKKSFSSDSGVKTAEIHEPQKTTMWTPPSRGKRSQLKPLSSASFRTDRERTLPPLRGKVSKLPSPKQGNCTPLSTELPKKDTCAITSKHESAPKKQPASSSTQRKSEQQVQSDHLVMHPKTVPSPKVLSNSASHQNHSSGKPHTPPPKPLSPSRRKEETDQDQEEMKDQDKSLLERSADSKSPKQEVSPDAFKRVFSSCRSTAKASPSSPLELMSVKSKIALFKNMQQVNSSQRADDTVDWNSNSCSTLDRMVKVSPVSSPRKTPLCTRKTELDKQQLPTEKEVDLQDRKHAPHPHQVVQNSTMTTPIETTEQENKASNSGPNDALGDGDEEEHTLAAMKITSGKAKQGAEESLEVKVYDTATQDALDAASTVAKGTLGSANETSQMCSSAGYPSQASEIKTDCGDENDYDDLVANQQLPQRKQKLTPPVTSQLPTAQEEPTLSDDDYDDVTFSYNTRPQLVASSTAAATNPSGELLRRGLPLESIPEYDVADTCLTPLPSGEATSTGTTGASDKEQSSSDSESEFYRRISTVTASFYDEMLASITSTIGPSGITLPQQQGGMGEEEFSHAVDQLVQQNPKLAGPIYESIEQYKRRSRFIIQSGFDDEPPALPPRPDGLSKPNRVATPSSVSFEDYVEMKSHVSTEESLVTSSASVAHKAVDPTLTEYELVIPLKNKRHKSPKRSISLKKQAERKKESGRSTIGSRTDDSRQAVKKKGRIHSLFSRSSRTEEAKPSSLPGSYKLCVGITDEDSFTNCSSSVTEYEILNTAAPQHGNVGRSLSMSAASTNHCHTYGNIGGQHAVFISPTHSSESEDETDSQLKPTQDDDNRSQEKDSQEPSKFKTSDSSPVFTGVSSQTPDSGVYPELSPTHTIRKYTREPLTPPLFTKLSVSSSTGSSCSLPMSSSDPSIHNTLLTDSKKRKHTGLDHKDISSPTGSLTKLMDADSDLDLDSTSYDSSRGGERVWQSPISRKRLESASPEKLKGAVQKEQLLAHARRKESVPETSEAGEDFILIPLVYADALMDRTTVEPDELSFSVNDVITVLDMTEDDWWQGLVDERIGWFPPSWVRLRIGQDCDDSSSEMAQDEDKEDHAQEEDHKEQEREKTMEVSHQLSSHAAMNGERENTGSGSGGDSQERRENGQFEKLPQKPQQENKPLHQQGQGRRSRKMTITRKASHEYPRKLTPTQVRARCVQEILSTERDYVQHLRDIIEGFLYPCQQHTKMFDSGQVETIFSNIEEIYRFQVEFLAELEARVVPNKMEESQIGQVFVQARHNFAKYSEYCNNHPHAVNEMNMLQQDSQYALFFESCRLLRNLTDISLDGFLLTPVQKICKYPLQLSELLKYTPEGHPDYPQVLAAQDAMKEVALLINERKRRMENIGKAGVWQETIDNWKGPDVLEHSTEMLYSGELHKISKGHSQERHFFLFDHQLVYCKKDAIGGKLSYKGRVNMDKCEVIDLADGEVTHNGSGVRHAWRISNVDKDKWYTLFARSAQEKEEWMEAFRKERRRISDDEKKGFVVTQKMKKSAIALHCGCVPAKRKNVHALMKSSDWVTESVGVQPSSRLDSLPRSPREIKKQKRKK